MRNLSVILVVVLQLAFPFKGLKAEEEASVEESITDKRCAQGDLSCIATLVKNEAVEDKEEVGFGRPDKDGYEWPTLYEMADDMLDVSLLMYPIAELRDMAKKTPEIFPDAKQILKEPITAREIEAMIEENRGLLIEKFQESKTDVLERALEAIVERHVKAAADDSKRTPKAVLVNFADDNAESELVYAIGVDNSRKRVTIAFRGSVTGKDWSQDAQIWMEKVENPLAHIEGQPKFIRIHHGFYEYLFYDTTSEDAMVEGVALKSKYEKIIDQIKVLMDANPGYKLFVTGHSLGAALASIFAFMVAALDDGIPAPVTCVSVASPYVGGANFEKAFKYLEEVGELRYLRLANRGDIVTAMPFFAANFGSYKHVGVELKLYSEKHILRHRILSIWHWLQRVWSNSVFNNLSHKPGRNHSPGEYNTRLEKARSVLSGMFLQDIYEGDQTK